MRFEGSKSNVLTYLQAADIFVLPSMLEGLSMSLIEAAAVGLPLLASDIPANRGVVRPGRNGLLFPAGDPEGLRAALGELLADAELRRSLGATARQLAERSYALESVAGAHIDLYERLATADLT